MMQSMSFVAIIAIAVLTVSLILVSFAYFQCRESLRRERKMHSIFYGLAECRDMARQLLRRGVDDAGVLALAERLQALSEEVEQITPKHDKL